MFGQVARTRQQAV